MEGAGRLAEHGWMHGLRYGPREISSALNSPWNECLGEIG